MSFTAFSSTGLLTDFSRVVARWKAISAVAVFSVVSAERSYRSALTLSRSTANAASSQAGPPARAISRSAAQATTSSNSAATDPCGLYDSASLAWLPSRPWIAFAGEVVESISNRRVPPHIACCCASGVSNSFTPTDSPSSTSAG